MHFSPQRLWGMLNKELILIRRQLFTYIMVVILPLIQVVFFGYVINTDAKSLRTIVVLHDRSIFTNDIISAFSNTGYFKVIKVTDDDNQGKMALKNGEAIFVITIPESFSRDLIRNRNPTVLVEGDATDPQSVVNGFRATNSLTQLALNRDLTGALQYLYPKSTPFNIDVHANYNPAMLSTYQTLPGLLTSILSLTLIILVALSIVNEFELGTMESLLITPVKPIEIILGKILPQMIIAIGIFIFTVWLSYGLFDVPIFGNVFILFLVTLPFIFANLSLGLLISAFAKSPLAAQNLVTAYNLPSLLLSGFLFPFYAMPTWAQVIGNIFPNAHYLRMAKNIMLKGATFIEVLPDLWPILLYLFVIVFLTVYFYRETLD